MMSSQDFRHKQVAALRGRVVLHTAAVGMLMLGAGVFVAWMLRDEPWPALAGGAVMFVPAIAIGIFVLGLAVIFQFRHAEWQLLACESGIELVTRTARGRVRKREALPTENLIRMSWIEGDADISSGLRVESKNGKGLFIPADSFDCEAFAAFAQSAYPGIPLAGLGEQTSPR